MERKDRKRTLERDELTQMIHPEVDRLPERLRAVIVLCDLQSESYDQAAARLRRARRHGSKSSFAREETLRGRIVRRGIALPAVL